jgi:hypothetical protein
MADEPEEEMARRRRQAVLGQGLRKIYGATADAPVPDEFYDLLKKAEKGEEPRRKPPKPAND